VNEKEMMRLFDNVGTNAATLESFLNGAMSVDEFIADRIEDTKHDLEKFPFQPILKALKKYPEGVPTGYFNDEKFEAVDMTDEVAVGTVMKAA
jgi:hypothetical protein